MSKEVRTIDFSTKTRFTDLELKTLKDQIIKNNQNNVKTVITGISENTMFNLDLTEIDDFSNVYIEKNNQYIPYSSILDYKSEKMKVIDLSSKASLNQVELNNLENEIVNNKDKMVVVKCSSEKMLSDLKLNDVDTSSVFIDYDGNYIPYTVLNDNINKAKQSASSNNFVPIADEESDVDINCASIEYVLSNLSSFDCTKPKSFDFDNCYLELPSASSINLSTINSEISSSLSSISSVLGSLNSLKNKLVEINGKDYYSNVMFGIEMMEGFGDDLSESEKDDIKNELSVNAKNEAFSVFSKSGEKGSWRDVKDLLDQAKFAGECEKIKEILGKDLAYRTKQEREYIDSKRAAIESNKDFDINSLNDYQNISYLLLIDEEAIDAQNYIAEVNKLKEDLSEIAPTIDKMDSWGYTFHEKNPEYEKKEKELNDFYDVKKYEDSINISNIYMDALINEYKFNMKDLKLNDGKDRAKYNDYQEEIVDLQQQQDQNKIALKNIELANIQEENMKIEKKHHKSVLNNLVSLVSLATSFGPSRSSTKLLNSTNDIIHSSELETLKIIDTSNLENEIRELTNHKISLYKDLPNFNKFSNSNIASVNIITEWTDYDSNTDHFSNRVSEFEFKDKNGNLIEPTKEEAALYLISHSDELPFELSKTISSFKVTNSAVIGDRHDAYFTGDAKNLMNDVYLFLNRSKDIPYDALNYLDNVDKERYNYCYDMIINDCLKIEGREFAKARIDALDWSPELLDFGLYKVYGLVDGVAQFGNGVKNIFNDEITYSSRDYMTGYLMEYIKSSYDFYEIMSGAYEISTSIGNMLPSIAASTIFQCPTFGTILMGASAGGNAKQEGLRMGMSLSEAWSYGILNGLSETLLERLLGGIPGLSKVWEEGGHGIKQYLKGMLSEGLEEGVQEILDPFFQEMCSPTGKTSSELWDEVDGYAVIKSALYGAISSGALSSVNLIQDYKSLVKTGDYMGINYLAQKYAGQNMQLEEVKKAYKSDLAALKASSLELSNLEANLVGNKTIKESYDNAISNKQLPKNLAFQDYVNLVALETVVDINNLTSRQGGKINIDKVNETKKEYENLTLEKSRLIEQVKQIEAKAKAAGEVEFDSIKLKKKIDKINDNLENLRTKLRCYTIDISLLNPVEIAESIVVNKDIANDFLIDQSKTEVEQGITEEIKALNDEEEILTKKENLSVEEKNRLAEIKKQQDNIKSGEYTIQKMQEEIQSLKNQNEQLRDSIKEAKKKGNLEEIETLNQQIFDNILEINAYAIRIESIDFKKSELQKSGVRFLLQQQINKYNSNSSEKVIIEVNDVTDIIAKMLDSIENEKNIFFKIGNREYSVSEIYDILQIDSSFEAKYKRVEAELIHYDQLLTLAEVMGQNASNDEEVSKNRIIKSKVKKEVISKIEQCHRILENELLSMQEKISKETNQTEVEKLRQSESQINKKINEITSLKEKLMENDQKLDKLVNLSNYETGKGRFYTFKFANMSEVPDISSNFWSNVQNIDNVNVIVGDKQMTFSEVLAKVKDLSLHTLEKSIKDAKISLEDVTLENIDNKYAYILQVFENGFEKIKELDIDNDIDTIEMIVNMLKDIKNQFSDVVKELFPEMKKNSYFIIQDSSISAKRQNYIHPLDVKITNIESYIQETLFDRELNYATLIDRYKKNARHLFEVDENQSQEDVESTVSELQAQINRLGKLSKEHIFKSPPTVDSQGKIILDEGTLIHGMKSYDENVLKSISKNGIMSSEAFNRIEDGETFCCADFFRVFESIPITAFNTMFFSSNTLKKITDRFTPFSKSKYGKDRIAFIVNKNSQNSELLSYDAYREGTVPSNVVKQFVTSLPMDPKTGSAILVGVPANCINGIVVGENIAIDQNKISYLKSLFPESYITTTDGSILYMPDYEAVNKGSISDINGRLEVVRSKSLNETDVDILDNLSGEQDNLYTEYDGLLEKHDESNSVNIIDAKTTQQLKDGYAIEDVMSEGYAKLMNKLFSGIASAVDAISKLNEGVKQNFIKAKNDIIASYNKIDFHKVGEEIKKGIISKKDALSNWYNGIKGKLSSSNFDNLTVDFENKKDMATYFGDSKLYLISLLIEKNRNKEIDIEIGDFLKLKNGIFSGSEESINYVIGLLSPDELTEYNNFVKNNKQSLFERWNSKLTIGEKWSLRNYAENFSSISASEAAEMFGYVSENSYVTINELMRFRNYSGSDVIDSAIEKFGILPSSIVTYRGVGIDALESQFGEIDVNNLSSLIGKKYTDKAYMSTSLLKSNASAAIGRPTDVILKIKVPNDANYGAFIEPYSCLGYNQNEFLIKKNSNSIIRNAYLNENGKIVVEMELLNDTKSKMLDEYNSLILETNEPWFIDAKKNLDNGYAGNLNDIQRADNILKRISELESILSLGSMLYMPDYESVNKSIKSLSNSEILSLCDIKIEIDSTTIDKMSIEELMSNLSPQDIVNLFIKLGVDNFYKKFNDYLGPNYPEERAKFISSLSNAELLNFIKKTGIKLSSWFFTNMRSTIDSNFIDYLYQYSPDILFETLDYYNEYYNNNPSMAKDNFPDFMIYFVRRLINMSSNDENFYLIKKYNFIKFLFNHFSFFEKSKYLMTIIRNNCFDLYLMGEITEDILVYFINYISKERLNNSFYDICSRKGNEVFSLLQKNDNIRNCLRDKFNDYSDAEILTYAKEISILSFYGQNYSNINEEDNFGVDQHVANNLANHLEFFPCADRYLDMLSNKYNVDKSDLLKIMRHMDSKDGGICSYANIANIIFESYKDYPEKFKQDFGYDMYVDGKLNQITLLTDLYIFANMEEHGGDFFFFTGNDCRFNFSSDWENHEQQFLSYFETGYNDKIIKAFLHNCYVNTDVYSPKSIGPSEISYMHKLIDDGKNLSIAITPDIDNGHPIFYYYLDEYNNIIPNKGQKLEEGGHITKILAVLKDGFVVQTWGRKAFLKYTDLIGDFHHIEIIDIEHK